MKSFIGNLNLFLLLTVIMAGLVAGCDTKVLEEPEPVNEPINAVSGSDTFEPVDEPEVTETPQQIAEIPREVLEALVGKWELVKIENSIADSLLLSYNRGYMEFFADGTKRYFNYDLGEYIQNGIYTVDSLHLKTFNTIGDEVRRDFAYTYSFDHGKLTLKVVGGLALYKQSIFIYKRIE